MKIKHKNIVVSGDISSGKSTLARNLAKELGWTYLSSGEFIRKWFKEHNLDLNDTQMVPEEVDRQLDMGYQQKMKNEEGIVFESHLGGWLSKDLPNTFKILVTANFDKRVERTTKREGISREEAIITMEKRAFGLVEKFKNLYGVENSFNVKYFDLMVDTSEKSPEQVLQTVLESLKD